MNRLTSLDQLAAKLLSAHAITDQLALTLAGWQIKVVSNSHELIADLAAYFKPFASQAPDPHLTITALEAPELDTGLDYTVKQPDPGKTKIKEEWADLEGGRVVRKRLTGMVFAFGGEHHLAVGPCLRNSNQVINFVNNRLIQLELNQGGLLAHAAGVNSGSAGLALAGFSGMGKSTLALHLMSHGVNFVSNDRLVVGRRADQTGMTGVPKLPRINPGTALNNPDLVSVIPPDEKKQFLDLSSDELWNLEHKYDVHIDECFGPGRFKLHSPMNALAILNWQRNGAPVHVQQVELSERLDLLAAFKKDWGLFFLADGVEPDHSDQAYLHALSGVTTFELSGGVDFLGAAKRLLDELGWEP